jgi:hypothetical protein
VNDRELLELAAKAAGIENLGWAAMSDAMQAITGVPERRGLWNPLTDDGDALRLAVKLGIAVCPYPIYSPKKHSVVARRLSPAPADDDENTFVGPELVEPFGSSDSPCAATRRAIVRAAAEIGRTA